MATLDRKQGRRDMIGTTDGWRAALVAAVCLLAGVALTAAQGGPDYSGYTASQFIPFVKTTEQLPFSYTPQLSINLTTGPDDDVEMFAVKMDTGSTGILQNADDLPNYQTLKACGTPGHQFLSSSKLLFVGTWVPATVHFYDGQREVATASVPVLGVEQTGQCLTYKIEDGGVCACVAGENACPCPPVNTCKCENGSRDCLCQPVNSCACQANGTCQLYPPDPFTYMGVGFGQEADFMPQATPDKNPLLNLTTIDGKPVAAALLNKGYIIDTNGVTVGLTPANTQGFGFIPLKPSAVASGDWHPAPMCVQINGSDCSAATGTILVDTGVAQSYITVPPSVSFKTVPNPQDSSGPQVLAPGTTVVVKLPPPNVQPEPVAVDDFTIGQGAPWEPLAVIPWSTISPSPFVNTGRHFLRKYRFLYDAKNGYVGMKPYTDR